MTLFHDQTRERMILQRVRETGGNLAEADRETVQKRGKEIKRRRKRVSRGDQGQQFLARNHLCQNLPCAAESKGLPSFLLSFVKRARCPAPLAFTIPAEHSSSLPQTGVAQHSGQSHLCPSRYCAQISGQKRLPGALCHPNLG